MAAGPWIPLLLFHVDSNKGTCYRKMYIWKIGVKKIWYRRSGGWALDSSFVFLQIPIMELTTERCIYG